MILYNAIKTPDGTLLESHYRHDYRVYVDRNGLEYMVDGGHDYTRRNIHEEAPYEELSVEDDGKFETRRQHLRWGSNYDGHGNRLPKTVYTPIKDLDTDHIINILKNVFTIDPIYRETFEQELDFRSSVMMSMIVSN